MKKKSTKRSRKSETKKFRVNILRSGYGWADFYVSAKNEVEAESLALEAAYNHVFSERDSDYRVESLEEVRG